MQDADSLDPSLGEKREGSFYVWTEEEVDEVLGDDTYSCKLFKAAYNVKSKGNADLSPRRYRAGVLSEVVDSTSGAPCGSLPDATFYNLED